jgi:hypothetical protein
VGPEGELIEAAASAAYDYQQWQRYYFAFAVPTDGLVTIGIRADSTVPGTSVMRRQKVDVAGLMLENISGIAASDLDSGGMPKPYIKTGETREALLPTCEDTTGKRFREMWSPRRCVSLCPTGLQPTCTGADAKTYCYRELSFSINARDIEAGNILNLSGFARGNFNYRIVDAGLNFVGTGTRDCSQSNTPSSCYGAGFIPYTIEHRGPYFVRNHAGQDYKAELFTGLIEHARGLAAERYLTNPLSLADQELISPYLRSELKGRPLDGTFVLRVWEDENVNFDAIEDVLLLLDYRYWTRFD